MIRPPDDIDVDALLGALLAPSQRDADRKFMAQVDRAIDARAAYARARSRFWQSFALESATVAALLAGLWILSTSSLLAPMADHAHWGLAPPLLLVLLLWFGTQRGREAY